MRDVLISKVNHDGMAISARLRAGVLTVTTRGTCGHHAEATEQLCWLSGVLNSVPSTYRSGVQCCSPSLNFNFDCRNTNLKVTTELALDPPWQSSLEEIYEFSIELEYCPIEKSQDSGRCWHWLFWNCVIIDGFPILR